ncbi:hypothetical protein [Shewanella sp. FJAT-52076]|uniref:hypothetical protein n=1 Tax=Shewanella sp. FJAT-52076 TaxID=2864202 RepID=UPI001C657D7F|nr:hypothetical protein [Shewanella sp. FJAT-52076]QYJ75223.1 hypothetical protein K0H79_18090 [Shewanella sp. FJAT-52076]
MSLRLPQLALKLLLITMLLGQMLTPVQALVSIVNAPVTMGEVSHEGTTLMPKVSHMSTMMVTGEHDTDCQTHCASHSESDCARHCASAMALPTLPLNSTHHHPQDAFATASWSLIAFIGSLQTPPPNLA